MHAEDHIDVRLATLLEAAVRAPSGDNLQPWLFEVEPDAGRLNVCLGEWLERSPLNLGRRMDRIALGAAIENVRRTARHNGWELDADPPSAPALAALRVRGPEGAPSIPAEVLARVTNRRLFDGTSLSTGTRHDLERGDPELPGVAVHWVFDDPPRARWAELVGRADRLMFGLQPARAAFLGNVRFDRPATCEVDSGLSLGALELGVGETLGMRSLRLLPDWFLRHSGMLGLFARHARALVASASGLCLVVGPDGSAASDLLIGQAMEHTWLELTRRGLAVQPMMSLLILDNIAEQGGDALCERVGWAALDDLRHDFRALVPEAKGSRPGFLLRFGLAQAPTSRTGRRDWRQATRLRAEHASARRASAGSVELM